jgi:phenylacetic acid degradation protein PaaD
MNALGKARKRADAMYANDAASKALGIGIEVLDAGAVVATMRVRDDMVNGFGICHGGLVFALADTAFAFACNAYDETCVAAAASIDFLRPAKAGDVLRAQAREDRLDGRDGYYSVEVFGPDGALVALFRGRSKAIQNSLK